VGERLGGGEGVLMRGFGPFTNGGGLAASQNVGGKGTTKGGCSGEPKERIFH